MTKNQEIKMILDSIKTINRYRHSPRKGFSGIVTPESCCREKKEDKLVKQLTKHLLDIRGYLEYKVVTWKPVNKPWKDPSTGVQMNAKRYTHKIQCNYFNEKRLEKFVHINWPKEKYIESITLIG